MILHSDSAQERFQVGKKALFWSYLSQFFQYGVSIFILPLLLNMMPAADMAIWYIFISISTIAGLVDFGFSPSLSKQVSFVYSGVTSLRKEGVDVDDKPHTINYGLLNDIYHTCKIFYKRISIIIGLATLVIGSIYLYFVIDVIPLRFVVAWFLFIASLVYNFYYNYILVFIRGKGLVEEYNKLVIISKTIYVFVLVVMLVKGFGLLSLVFGNFLSTFVFRFLGRNVMLSENEVCRISQFHQFNNLTSTIWYNAKRYGITSLGVALLAQSSIFLSGLFLSLNEVAELGLTVQIFTILAVVCRVMLTTYMPKISSLFVINDLKTIRRYFLLSQGLSYSIYVVTFSVIYLLGNKILSEIIHSHVMLLNGNVLLLYFFFYLMELTHGNCVTLISAENKVPYYKASLVSGVLSITVTLLLLILNVGIYSFPIGLICGSLPYNSWKWPLVVYKRLFKYE